MNNTEYICVSATNDGDTISDPAYIIIAGESVYVIGTKHLLYGHIACTCNETYMHIHTTIHADTIHAYNFSTFYVTLVDK